MEDDADIREALEVGLGLSYEVVSTDNGRDAVRLVSENEFDAVVLDLQLPELDGEDVLRSLEARSIQVPVVVISAHDHARLADCARRFSLAGVVPKPFRLSALESRLAAVTSGPTRARSTLPGDRQK